MAFNSNLRSNRRKLKSEINVVPYIDVMLVLLIIFMAVPPSQNPSQINLPSAERTTQPPNDYIQIAVKEKGQLSIGIAGKTPQGLEDVGNRTALLERLRSQRQLRQRVRCLMLGQAAGERRRVGVADVIEGDHSGHSRDEFRWRGALGLDERGVRAGRASHRLGRVVDQDVQRALRGDRVRQRDDLGRVPQVDADHLEPVQPVGAVGHRGEATHGVVGEAGGDRGVRAVAQQPQRDVHADLGAAAGEQGRAAAEVGAGVALGPVEGGAVGAELVVERIDLGVVVLAHVAGPRADQGACAGPVAADTRGRPWVSSSMRPGAPVAVAATTARSAAATASRLACRRARFTDLKTPAVASRTATASGCSGGSDSTSDST